jgi:hypothetical protein
MQYKSLIIRGGKIPAKTDPSAKTTRPDRPSVRPQAIFRWIWIWILFYFIFSSFLTDNGFGIFFRVSTRPARPFINNIKKKNLIFGYTPPHPTIFFSLKLMVLIADPIISLSSLISIPLPHSQTHHTSPHSLSMTMSLPRRKTKEAKRVESAWAWAEEVAWVGRRTGRRRRHG